MSQHNQPLIPDNSPFSPEQAQWLNSFLPTLNQEQVLWLSGYFSGVRAAQAPAGMSAGAPAQATQAPAAVAAGVAPPAASRLPVTILYGTESGNSEELADEAKKMAATNGFDARVQNVEDYDANRLSEEENVLMIISTWGDGDPPQGAEEFHEFMHSDEAPRLDNVRFSVCALGDTSYEEFCKCGKDFDARFEELGGKRIHPRTDCDVDFDEPFQHWAQGVMEALKEFAPEGPSETNGTSAPGGSVGVAAPPFGGGGGGTAVMPQVAPPQQEVFSRRNPFPAKVTDNINLNGRGSAKETRHIELSLEGSGLEYVPGDALGIVPQNCPEVVDDILKVTGFRGTEPVGAVDGEDIPLRRALTEVFDVTSLSQQLVEKYAERAQLSRLDKLLDHPEELKEYMFGRELFDLLRDFPIRGLTAEELISLLRKLPPRLYSIASSLRAHPGEVHLTVAAVRYSTHGRERKGVASTFLADRIEVGDTVPVYIHPNKNFKLPEDANAPIIMVGPGTGVAPFRAFVEERLAVGATGRNWLFFGDQKMTYDFLYQLEWQEHLASGALHKLDVAFSRDQKQKVYVQHRMLERSKELFAWIEEGAYFYVCGDASRMAHDVDAALHEIVQREGSMSEDNAKDYVKKLKKENRYQRDVY